MSWQSNRYTTIKLGAQHLDWDKLGWLLEAHGVNPTWRVETGQRLETRLSLPFQSGRSIMVSSLTLLRLHNAQAALQTLRGQASSSAQTSPQTSVANALRNLGHDASGSSLSNRTLASLIDALAANGTKKPAATVKATDDISSNDFMKALKAKLTAPEDDPTAYIRSQDMLKALSDGALTVTDPVTGKTIDAWDPDVKGSHPQKAQTTTKSNWSAFLDAHLKRGSDGAFVRSTDGNYIDKSTGENALFTELDGRYYYMTWPAATKEATSSSTQK
ncbi:hypothetical protein [Rhizobium sp. WYJ-E13]|uniref:hypothetical protein n=1 Tax=Rhizobium sp. WYJ-E13 TaxID=2849093 RepID=UPI001C1EB3BE|nr:hypothetical protein [Rhizobium sp. WYJ-E13]QWW72310.1 hypothetical protein KQ933_32570 [Rhizobium sp. WYJ-E13]